MLRLMRQDKKVQSGKLTLILAKQIGSSFATRDVAPDTLLEFLGRALHQA